MLAGGDVVECHIATVVSDNRFTGLVQDIAGATDRIAIGISRLDREAGRRLRNLERHRRGSVGCDSHRLRIRIGEVVAGGSTGHANRVLAGGDVVECHIATVVSDNRFTGLVQDIAGATDRVASGIRGLNSEAGCRLRNLERRCC